MMWLWVGIVAFLLFTLGLSLVVSKAVYGDYRCAVAECRIVKE